MEPMLEPAHIAQLAFEAPVAFLSVDSEGRIRWANRQAGVLLGRGHEELTGLPILEIYAPGEHGRVRARELFQRFLAGEAVLDEPVLLVRGDGVELSASLSFRGCQPEGCDGLISFSILRPGTACGSQRVVTDEHEHLSARLAAERAAERSHLEHVVSENVNRLLLPLVSRARSTANTRNRYVLDAIHDALQFLTQPFGAELAARAPSLTPREIEVCALVRSGLGSKEIGTILGISHRSVEVHRSNVRRKLGLTDSSVRLAAFLAGPAFGSRG
jgi:PAS domain S-box-containing protein